MELWVAPGLWAVLMVGSGAGWWLRARLHERHRTAQSVDALRTVMSMMVTFAALVLGLLTSAAKSDFDARVHSLHTFGISLIELNQRLREYGPDAGPVRLTLRRYTAAAIADTWRSEPQPAGDYPRPGSGTAAHTLESAQLGVMLLDVDEQIALLVPATPLQRQLAPLLVGQMTAALQRRWDLVAGSNGTLSWPIVAVLLLWLALAFFLFGLSTEPNRLAALVLSFAALSVAADGYLIVDLDTPLSGQIQLPSEPLRDALSHMDANSP